METRTEVARSGYDEGGLKEVEYGGTLTCKAQSGSGLQLSGRLGRRKGGEAWNSVKYVKFQGILRVLGEMARNSGWVSKAGSRERLKAWRVRGEGRLGAARILAWRLARWLKLKCSWRSFAAQGGAGAYLTQVRLFNGKERDCSNSVFRSRFLAPSAVLIFMVAGGRAMDKTKSGKDAARIFESVASWIRVPAAACSKAGLPSRISQ